MRVCKLRSLDSARSQTTYQDDLGDALENFDLKMQQRTSRLRCTLCPASVFMAVVSPTGLCLRLPTLIQHDDAVQFLTWLYVWSRSGSVRARCQ